MFDLHAGFPLEKDRISHHGSRWHRLRPTRVDERKTANNDMLDGLVISHCLE